MTRSLALELPDEVYNALAQLASGTGQRPEQMVAEWLANAAGTIGGLQKQEPTQEQKRGKIGRGGRTKSGRVSSAASGQGGGMSVTRGSNAGSTGADRAHRSGRSAGPSAATAAVLGPDTQARPGPDSIYQLKVTLLEVRPLVWRRIQVPGNTTLAKLHRILQAAMGWEDYHLHQFYVGEERYGVPDPEWDSFPDMRVKQESSARLYRVAPTEGTRFAYQYDFGDDWQHEVLVERIEPIQEVQEGTARTTQAICVDGKRRIPPEDVGGPGGYQQFLRAIRNPRHREHEDWLRWAGGRFDPEEFDLEAINEAIKRIK